MIAGIVSLHSVSILMDINVSRILFWVFSEIKILDSVLLISLMMCFLNEHSECYKWYVQSTDASIDVRQLDSDKISKITRIVCYCTRYSDVVFLDFGEPSKTQIHSCHTKMIINMCTKIILLLNHCLNLSEWAWIICVGHMTCNSVSFSW